MSSGGWLTDDQSGTASTGHNGKRLSVAHIFIAWRSSDFAVDVALQAEPGTTPSVTDALWGRLLLVSVPVAHGESKRLFFTSWLAWWQGGSRAGGIFSSLRWSSLSVTGTDMLLRKYEKRWFVFNRMLLFFKLGLKKNIKKFTPFHYIRNIFIQWEILYACTTQSAANLMRVTYIHQHCQIKKTNSLHVLHPVQTNAEQTG